MFSRDALYPTPLIPLATHDLTIDICALFWNSQIKWHNNDKYLGELCFSLSHHNLTMKKNTHVNAIIEKMI